MGRDRDDRCQAPLMNEEPIYYPGIPDLRVASGQMDDPGVTYNIDKQIGCFFIAFD